VYESEGGNSVKIADDNVVDQLRQRNPDALAYLILRYSATVAGLVQRVSAGALSSQDIEECVADVFVHIWQRPDDYHPERGTMVTWVLILGKYKALDRRRRNARHKAAPSDDASHFAATAKDPVWEEVNARETQEAWLQFVRTLPSLDREIFVRRFVLYHSIDEIAHQLGRTSKAIENRLYRVRKSLKLRVQRDVTNDRDERVVCDES